MKGSGIGIVGIGTYLPPDVRTNDAWPAEVVASFGQRPEEDIGVAQIDRAPNPNDTRSESALIAIEEMGKWKDDPFHGAKERHIAAKGTKSSDMEVIAAKRAMENAGVKPSDIDLLEVFSFLPDFVVPDNAGSVHHQLGLSRSAPAIPVGGVCGSFLLQLRLAVPFLQQGGGRYALLIQSALQSPIVNYKDPLSTTFGDAATAVVLGPVEKGEGILSCVTSVDGRYAKAAVVTPDEATVPWWSGISPMHGRSLDHARGRELGFVIGDMARSSLDEALEEANLTRKDVDFFTAHQTIAAFSTICRRSAGLDDVPSVDTFPTVGSISSSALPYNLAIAEERGMLRKGSVASLFTTGAGFNWGTALIRWSR